MDILDGLWYTKINLLVVPDLQVYYFTWYTWTHMVMYYNKGEFEETIFMEFIEAHDWWVLVISDDQLRGW